MHKEETYVSSHIKTRKVMASEQDQLDNIACEHQPAKHPKVARIDSDPALAIHSHSDGPMCPVVREDENHGDNFAIDEAVNDSQGYEKGCEQHDGSLGGEESGEIFEGDVDCVVDGDVGGEAPGGDFDKGLEPAE